MFAGHSLLQMFFVLFFYFSKCLEILIFTAKGENWHETVILLFNKESLRKE